MTQKKRTYTAPDLNKYQSLEKLPARFRDVAEEILQSRQPMVITVDEKRQYLEVSEEFAQMLGYSARELVGKRMDDVTVKDILDIDLSFRVVRRFGELQGLWLFESRDGRPLLCSYYARKVNSKYTAELRPISLAA
jgi:PAS domain S-box-containing protein